MIFCGTEYTHVLNGAVVPEVFSRCCSAGRPLVSAQAQIERITVRCRAARGKEQVRYKHRTLDEIRTCDPLVPSAYDGKRHMSGVLQCSRRAAIGFVDLYSFWYWWSC